MFLDKIFGIYRNNMVDFIQIFLIHSNFRQNRINKMQWKPRAIWSRLHHKVKAG